MIFKVLGAIGMLLLVYGIINKSSLKRNELFTIGGLFLLAYSVYLRDPIFIPLQIIFSTASIYEIYCIRNKDNHRK